MHDSVLLALQELKALLAASNTGNRERIERAIRSLELTLTTGKSDPSGRKHWLN